MKDKADIQESGAAGKPGESTAVAEKITLNATGMEHLLKSEFAQAAGETETAPAKEIPAAAESDEAKSEEENPATGDEQPKTDEVEHAEAAPGEGEAEAKVEGADI